jgi:hypothetical protein
MLTTGSSLKVSSLSKRHGLRSDPKDFSNYWTAALYYRARNGTFKRVQQFENGGLKQNQGMTVYYIPPYDGVSNVTAFKTVRPLPRQLPSSPHPKYI